jgi:hypothetical protein
MDFVNLEMMVAMITQHQELNAKINAGQNEYAVWRENNYDHLRAASIRFIDQAQKLRRDNGGHGYSSYLLLAELFVRRKWTAALEILESMGVTHLDGDEPVEV